MDARPARFGVSLLATLLSGCMAGPNYNKPAVPTSCRVSRWIA